MKALCSVKALATAAAAASRICNGHSSIPILANVLLRVKDGAIELAVTDLETTLTQRVAASESSDGACTVPAKLFADYLGALPGATEISLEGTESRVTTKVGRGTYDFQALSPEDFPPLPKESGAIAGGLPGPTLQDVVSKIAFCAASDEMRGAVLAGIGIQGHADGSAELVATDGFRLALARMANLGCKKEFTHVAPAGAMVAAARTVGKADSVNFRLFGHNGNQLAVESDDATLTVRLVDGVYPNYKQVIPTTVARRVRVGVEGLVAALRRALTVSGDRASMVLLTFGKEGVTLTASSQEIGNAHEDIAVISDSAASDEALAVAVNGRFLAEILLRAGCNEIEIGLTGSLSPMLLDPVDQPEDGSHTLRYVLMPLRQ